MSDRERNGRQQRHQPGYRRGQRLRTGWQRTLRTVPTVVGAVAVVAMLAAGLFVASPAGAQDAQLTVTPSTGLSDGTEVQIEATSGPLGVFGLGVCASGADLSSIVAAARDCELLTSQLSGGAVDLSLPWTASSLVRAATGRLIDCRTEGCQIAFAGGEDFTAVPAFVETVAIEFDDGVTVGVTPDLFLVDQQEVEVAVPGADPGDRVDVLSCLAAAVPGRGGPVACTDLDAVGTASLAERWIADASGQLRDCAVVSCVIGVRLTDTSGPNGAVRYGFAPVSFTSRADVEVTGTSGFLADGDEFEVAATNIDRLAADRTVAQCRVRQADLSLGPSNCVATNAVVDNADRSTYSSSVRATRFIDLPAPGGGTTPYDCAKTPEDEACIFAIVGGASPGGAAFTLAERLVVIIGRSIIPVRIDRIPELEVLDNDGIPLPRSSVVDVRIDVASTIPAVLALCLIDDAVDTITDARRLCDTTEIGPHPDDHIVALRIDQEFRAPGRWADCSVNGRCEVVYLASTDDDVAQRAHRDEVRFARAASIFPTGSVSAGINSSLSIINLDVADGSRAAVLQCGFGTDISFDDFHCRSGEARDVVDGAVSGSLALTRFIPTADGGAVDCAQTPTRCLLVLLIVDPVDGLILGPAAPIQVSDPD